MKAIDSQRAAQWKLFYRNKRTMERHLGLIIDAAVSHLCTGMCHAALLSAEIGTGDALFATENWNDLTLPY
jgi:hypothetical protein